MLVLKMKSVDLKKSISRGSEKKSKPQVLLFFNVHLFEISAKKRENLPFVCTMSRDIPCDLQHTEAGRKKSTDIPYYFLTV
jgi:hypothetical protein